MQITKFLLDLIWPNRCAYCDKVIKWNEKYCKECYEQMEFTGFDNCKVCGQSPCECVYKNGKRAYPRFDSCISVADYKTSSREMVLNLKFHRSVYAAEVMAEFMYEKIKDIDYINPIVIPIPMYTKKESKRGYNQTKLIAKHLAKYLDYPYSDKVLFKIRDTKPQKDLTAAQRKKNVLKAFEVKLPEEVKYRDVILVDDVITTGSTLNECAKMLKRAGALSVNVVTFATNSFSRNLLTRFL